MSLSFRRLSRPGFTLVELIVVISIIALLIAMLLPALSRVREIAHRADCLSNKRQLGIATYVYAQDNKDMIPHPVVNWTSTRDVQKTRKLISQEGAGLVLQATNERMLGMGVLIAYDYATAHEMFFCHSYVADGAADTWNKPDFGKEPWQRMQDGFDPWGGFRSRVLAGVSDFMVFPTPGGNIGAQEHQPSTTIAHIADRWRNDTSVSPVMYACRNAGDHQAAFIETDGAGVERTGPHQGPSPDGRELSHERQGVNAVMVDGSARWVDRSEVLWSIGNVNWGHLMANSNNYQQASNLQAYARQHMTISGR